MNAPHKCTAQMTMNQLREKLVWLDEKNAAMRHKLALYAMRQDNIAVRYELALSEYEALCALMTSLPDYDHVMTIDGQEVRQAP